MHKNALTLGERVEFPITMIIDCSQEEKIKEPLGYFIATLVGSKILANCLREYHKLPNQHILALTIKIDFFLGE